MGQMHFLKKVLKNLIFLFFYFCKLFCKKFNENKKQNYLLFSQDEFEWKNISNNKLKQDLFQELEIKHNVEINFTKTRGKWIRNDDTKWYYKIHGIKWELKK